MPLPLPLSAIDTLVRGVHRATATAATPSAPLSSAPAPADVPPVPLADRLAAFTAAHPFYSYTDVLDAVFGEDEDGFIDAWCSGALPREVRRACEETMSDRTIEILLLRRVVRQLGTLTGAIHEVTAVLREGAVSVFESPDR